MDAAARREAISALHTASLVLASKIQRGRVIVAPNNSGKSTYARAHPRWVDHDRLLREDTGMGQKPPGGMDKKDMQAADAVTKRHRARGTNMLVATWWDPALVDAFVIIPQAELRRRDLTREQLAEAAKQAIKYRAVAKGSQIPVYASFEAASAALLRG